MSNSEDINWRNDRVLEELRKVGQTQIDTRNMVNAALQSLGSMVITARNTNAEVQQKVKSIEDQVAQLLATQHRDQADRIQRQRTLNIWLTGITVLLAVLLVALVWIARFAL